MTEIVEREGSKSASCLLLPQLPGVDVYSFTTEVAQDEDFYFGAAGDLLNSNRSGSLMHSADEGAKSFSAADIDNITKIPADKEVRAMLLFLTEMNETDSEFGQLLVRRYGAANTLVAGGFADRVITGSTHSQ